MRRLHRFGFAIGPLLWTACFPTQEPAPPVPPPQQVRVRVTVAPNCPVTSDCPLPIVHEGPVISWRRDTLVIFEDRRGDIAPAIHVPSITKIELYRGMKPSAGAAARRGAIGLLVGAAVGAAIGGAAGAVVDEAGEGAATGAIYGSAVGAASGVSSGLTAGEADWEEATVESVRRLYCHAIDATACAPVEPPVVSMSPMP